MARVILRFSRTQVDAAGKILVQKEPNPSEYEHALEVISNWRAVHNIPLLSIRIVLAQRAKKVYEKALVAQRIKRLPAIQLKLRLIENLKLSRMQDVGGCRAILVNMKQVRQLKKLYLEGDLSHKLHNIDDYIDEKPKDTGYRGLHLIYKFASESYPEYHGLRIEIQIRSLFQHAFATAVEVVDTFTQQALKSNIGDDDWKRFFQLAGAAFAIRELTKPVPNTPTEWHELMVSLKEYTEKLDVLNAPEAFGQAMDVPKHIIGTGYYFLLKLDAINHQIAVVSFKKTEFEKATDTYLKLERELASAKGMQSVLVSIASLTKFAQLKKAYPNYFLDTRFFIACIKDCLGIEKLKASPR